MTALDSNLSRSLFFPLARGGSSAEEITEAAALLRRSIRMFFARSGSFAGQTAEATLAAWYLVQFLRHRRNFLHLSGQFPRGNNPGDFA